MLKKTITTAMMVIAFVTFCFAQDITGKWSGRIMDQFDVTYDFKVDGEKLTGNTTGPDGSVVPLQDGVIKGDDLSFTIHIMDNDMKVTGKVKGTVITLTMPGMGGGEPVSFDLKKAQ